MDKIVIEGGKKLKGRVKVSGSKNAALPLMAACILSDQVIILKNVPHLADIKTMANLLQSFGAKVSLKRHRFKFQLANIKKDKAEYDLVRTMRASILVLGPMLARHGEAIVSLPGGCAIGARPVDLHLQALEAMGAKIEVKAGYIYAKAKKLKGAEINFEKVTVTGTENILMAACLAEGKTVLKNAALEPEVVDLALMLKAMGAKIEGEGSSEIHIEGVPSLGAIEYSIMADRIEAGTFMVAAAMTEGDIYVEGCELKHVDALVQKLKKTGVKIKDLGTSIHVKGIKKIKSVNMITEAFPGFATDFQAQYMALMCLAEGKTEITENIFENRFMHVGELNRMGAHIEIDGKKAIIHGVKKFSAAPVMATDLRASACLVLAGLAAEGITEVNRVYHLDRGYEDLEKKFRKLGARIKRRKVRY